MRIVAGLAGRLALQTPQGLDVRPTMDKVRAAIFDSIGPVIENARVADLFAGTGAMGIEALSRGATQATFVEKDRRALACIRENLRRTKLLHNAHILPIDVTTFLARQPTGRAQDSFHIIFADPPYASRKGAIDYAPLLLGANGLARLLADDGLLVLELPSSWDAFIPANWLTLRDQTYGRTRIVFLRPCSPIPAQPPDSADLAC